ncbi:MAG: redox-regulated ATPase YchF [Chloroflexi bacterium]|nr:redox-regulated ATPase YchF [Chloroflexota bacterium]
MEFGIIGLPGSGKTTLFNALTRRGGVEPSHGAAPHLGVVKVPDPRLSSLAGLFHPEKIVPAEARYIDFAARVGGKGIAGESLAQISTAEALIHVVGAFAGEGGIPEDIDAMDLELAFSDLAIIERRLERIAISMKGARAEERQALIHEQELLARLKGQLEQDVPVREVELTPGESRLAGNFQFLTAKPMLVVVNIAESSIPRSAALETELNARYSRDRCRVIVLCASLEMELSQLEDAAAAELRAGYGLEESGLDRTISASYEMLGLITFFTTVSREVRAWPVPAGITAVKAAGKIHSDMERGFIRAEVISHADLLRCGSLAEARKQGLLRLEGKDYVVRDGDVITFLFNV